MYLLKVNSQSVATFFRFDDAFSASSNQFPDFNALEFLDPDAWSEPVVETSVYQVDVCHSTVQQIDSACLVRHRLGQHRLQIVDFDGALLGQYGIAFPATAVTNQDAWGYVQRALERRGADVKTDGPTVIGVFSDFNDATIAARALHRKRRFVDIESDGNVVTCHFRVGPEPTNYETCADCGFDHEHEDAPARRWHIQHGFPQTSDFEPEFYQSLTTKEKARTGAWASALEESEAREKQILVAASEVAKILEDFPTGSEALSVIVEGFRLRGELIKTDTTSGRAESAINEQMAKLEAFVAEYAGRFAQLDKEYT